MKAKQIMRKRVITVAPETTLRELAKIFIENRISGAPVVNSAGKLLGVVSQTDLVRREREGSPPAETPGFYREAEKEVRAAGFHVEAPELTQVNEVMTPVVLSADEDATVEELARFMLKRHIHRVVITRGEKLKGIVSSMDVMRALLDKLDGAAPGPAPA